MEKKTIAEILSAVDNFRTQNRMPQPKPDFTSPISYLGFSSDIAKALGSLGITSIAELAHISDKELLNSNVPQKNLLEIWTKLFTFLTTSASALVLFEDKNTVDYLRLSVRAAKVIKALKISTVGELAKVSDNKFLQLKNFGKKSLCEVRRKLVDYCVAKGWFGQKCKPERKRFPKNPRPFLEKLLLQLPQKQREIVIGRFGLWDGEIETLEDLGDSFGCTRERIRQIELKALEKLRWPVNVEQIRQFLDRLYRKYLRPILKTGYGLVTEDELRGVFMSLFASPQEGVIAERFISKTQPSHSG